MQTTISHRIVENMVCECWTEWQDGHIIEVNKPLYPTSVLEDNELVYQQKREQENHEQTGFIKTRI